MKRGGKRENAGRRAGTLNKATIEIKSIIDSSVDFNEVVDKMIQLVRGVTVQEFKAGIPIVYEKPPDVGAAKLLLEYRFGKPHQSIDLSHSGDTLVKFITVDAGDTNTVKKTASGPEGDTQ